MTPKVRTLYRQADQLAESCYNELKAIIDWLEGVDLECAVGAPPNDPTLEEHLRHLRTVCTRLHAALEDEASPAGTAPDWDGCDPAQR